MKRHFCKYVECEGEEIVIVNFIFFSYVLYFGTNKLL